MLAARLVEGTAWPRLNCLVIVASDADTSGYREKPAKSRESVPDASLRIGTGLGRLRGLRGNDNPWDECGSMLTIGARLNFSRYARYAAVILRR
jgi:hypothetical protein